MKHIVIADDDKEFLYGLADMLENENAGYDVFVAQNGEQAERHLSAHESDLLITDLRMPVMDGVELMRRAAISHPGMPVIVVSACLNSAVINEFSKNTYYFDKPVDVAELISTIHHLLTH